MFIFITLASMGALFVYSRKIDEVPVAKEKSNSKVPTIYDHLFIATANKYGLDWKMLKRISWIESNTGLHKSVARGLVAPNDKEGSVSEDKKSWGLMQMTLTTAGDYDKTVTYVKLNNPAYAIDLSGKHLSFIKRAYPTFSERDVIMSYNHGQGNQLKFIAAEKGGTLLVTQYPAGRAYWAKYQKAKELI